MKNAFLELKVIDRTTRHPGLQLCGFANRVNVNGQHVSGGCIVIGGIDHRQGQRSNGRLNG